MTQNSHTPYIPIWYTPENAAKYKNTAESVSRQINIDKIQPLPRLSLVALGEVHGEYELELLSKAETYGLNVPHDTSNAVDFAELEYLVGQYENLDEEGLELAEKARIYHMPINETHLKNIMNLRFEIEDYELLLDRADNAHIDWDTSTYDPEGLESAVAEANWNFEQQYWDYRHSVLGWFKAGRGV